MADLEPARREAEEDDFLIYFPETRPPDLEPGAPLWARHLHDCQHGTKRQVDRLEYQAGKRDAKLDKILLLMGEESDDGESGRGFIGIALRNRKRIEGLEGERNIMRGAFLALSALAGALAVMFGAWAKSLVTK